MKDYYKKIDKSFFKYGTTIPKAYIESFIFGEEVELGKSRDIIVVFKKNRYKCKLNHINRSKSPSVYQLRWDSNTELLKALKIEYIQTYIAIESQNFRAKKEDKYYITKLMGGNQEVAIIKPKNKYEFNIETFIKIETPYDELFSKLIERNVFGWISKINNKSMIYKSTKWIDISELKNHEDIPYVIYYLLDQENKELYIGSAKKLGDRVKPNRSEIPNWNKFRYEIVHPEFHPFLRELEYHSIMNFAHFFVTEKKISNLSLSEYKLVNKDFKYYVK